MTQDVMGASESRARRCHIDAEHSAGPTDVLVGPFDVSDRSQPAVEIVVEASSPNLMSARATIALSTDEASDGVLAVAAASVHDPLHFV